MDIQQCFEILELDHSASLDELNQAYRDLAAVWHPDRFPNNPRLKAKAEEKFKIINEAYEKLLSFLTAIPGQDMMPYNSVERSESYLKSTKGLKLSWSALALFQSIFKKHHLSALQRPWVRFIARTIDYMLLASCLQILGFNTILLTTEISWILFPIFLVTAWIIIESALLSLFGWTPGKWLLKTTVYDIFQLKLTFSWALRRSLSVWCNGIGMGVPFIAPVTMAISYYRIKRKALTSWDSDGRFSIRHEEIGKARISVIIIFFLIMIYCLARN